MKNTEVKVEQEKPADSRFLITEDEKWLWEVQHPNGKIEQAPRSFPTLKECVDVAIVLTGSVPLLTEEFRTQLKPGGRLLAVVGEPRQ